MLKIIIMVAATAFSTLALAKKTPAKPHDILAVCSSETGHTPLFEVTGDLSQFTGPRITYQFGEVTLVNVRTKAVFNGHVTLTKNTPHQFILNGYSTPSLESALTHVEENSVLYGISSGTHMTLVKNRDGVTYTKYSCELNSALLVNP